MVIYLAISVAETVALLLARMPLYDAVVHTFGTVATGVSATRPHLSASTTRSP